MISTGNAVLDDIATEYKRMNNIDVFNNACACFFDLRTWVRMGKPQEVRNNMYAISPWFATLKRMQSSPDTGSASSSKGS